ncbi:hypothetical protein EIP91_003123 [Steccherinum ochraceum]|uniref:2'-phosphotransferase n=1 Tax=Steccherinum ochraceum TaxID=92696 RepID=A0A4R0RS65_9APHY|nr:hypothetical protein EIP91_003123 [Steccherinum ochraceum]
MENPPDQDRVTSVGNGAASEPKQAVSEPHTIATADQGAGTSEGGKRAGKRTGKQPKPQQKQSNGKEKQQQQNAPKMRGLPTDSEETRMSKTLTWILRHGSESEGLTMRPDGYVRVQDILARPRFKAFDMPLIERIVATDSKSRFGLLSEPDPASASPTSPVWWIRANQGHSLKKVVQLETTLVSCAADIPTGIAVHGTTLVAWESIQNQGLSKMKRNHIHLAQGVPGSGVISGMRKLSEIYIYVDVDKAIASGLAFSLSANGVVLTEGDERGFLAPDFFSKVVKRNGDIVLQRDDSDAVGDLEKKTESIML